MYWRFHYFFFKISWCSSYQLQLEAQFSLTPSWGKDKVLYTLKPLLSQKLHGQLPVLPNCKPLLSFPFHNTKSVTIFKFKKWVTIPACFKNGEISYSILAFNFKNWPFGIIVTRHSRPESDHSIDRIYYIIIARKLKMLFNERSGSFLRPTIHEL